MGKRERYEPGTFCWIDLATTNAGAAKSFHGELFGWEAQDNPAGGGMTYSMMHLNDDVVCGLFYMGDEMKAADFPASWQSYVNVEDAGKVTAKAKELGGEVLEEPFDVMDSGRSAVIRDPQGALVPLWEPHGHIGAARVNDTGCFCLNELNTSDPEKAAEFYTRLFGWEVSRVSEDPPYWGIHNKGSLNGGMGETTDETPPHWQVYFTTEDLDDSAAGIERLGGEIMVPPVEVPPQSRILIASDPQGATFGLFEGEVDE